MSYKEVSRGASPAELQQYASGIGQISKLVDKLLSQGKLPERFAGVPSRLHPSLEGKVRIEPLTIGGKPKEELLRDLERRYVKIGFDAESMVGNADFTILPEPQPRELVIGSVGDLVPNPKGTYATTEEIWTARDEKGLEPVPAEAALHYLLQKGAQLQLGDAIWMSMKTIADSYGHPDAFVVWYSDGGLLLDSYRPRPSDNWRPEHRFAFSLPQV